MTLSLFDFRQFLLDNFGHAENVARLMRVYLGAHPGTSTIYKWFARGSVPGIWFAVLLSILELENGGPVSTAKYLKGA